MNSTACSVSSLLLRLVAKRSRLQSLPARSLFIQVHDTPNPLSLKFVPGVKVLTSGTAEFTKTGEAKNSPLARLLLRIGGVQRVFFGEEFVTITKKDDSVDWKVLKPQVFATLMDFFSTGGAVIVEKPGNDQQPSGAHGQAAEAQGIFDESDRETVEMIKELLETRIRPTIQEDGGDVTFVSYKNGVLKLKLQGSCTGCPSSTVTLKSGIQNMVQFYLPEVQTVEQVMDESDQTEEAFRKFEKTLEK